MPDKTRQYCVHVSLLLLLLVPLISSQHDCAEHRREVCGWGWMVGNPQYPTCYLLDGDTRTWEDAKRNCQSVSARLLVIKSHAELEWLKTLPELRKPTVNYWVGLSAERHDHKSWSWVDGTKVPDEYWRPHEPNNNDNSEYCGELRNESDAVGLNDFVCARKLSSICEKPPVKPCAPVVEGDTVLTDGESLTLTCVSDPSFTSLNSKVTWYRNGNFLNDVMSDVYTLPPVGLTDNQAVYSCRLTYRNVMSDSSEIVTLSVKPQTPTLHGEQVLTEGETGNLTCLSNSSTTSQILSVVWYKDGNIEDNVTSVVYILPPVTLSDNKAVYSCRVVYLGVQSDKNNFTLSVLPPPPDACRDTAGEGSFAVSNPLCKGFEVAISQENVENVVREIHDDLSLAPNVSLHVTLVSSLLTTINKNVKEISPQTAQQVLDIVGAMNDSRDSSTLDQQNNTYEEINKMVQALEDLGSKITFGNDTDGRVQIFTSTMAVETVNVTKVIDDAMNTSLTDDDIVGFQLTLDDGKSVAEVSERNLKSISPGHKPGYNNTDTAIKMPASLLGVLSKEHEGKDLRMSMNIFTNTKWFQHGTLESTNQDDNISSTSEASSIVSAVLNSKVISARVTVDGQPITDLGTSHVKTIFLPIQQNLTISDRARRTVCVFWNFTGAAGKGAWSDRGCNYSMSTDGHDVCVCDHLTHFAVLMKPDGARDRLTLHDSILSILTKVGLAISILGLSATILCFFLVRKWRRGRPQQVVVNLAIAMLCAWVVFLAGFERVENDAWCKAVAALLHYFILASFMWMLVEGVLQYLLLVKVMGGVIHHFMIKTLIASWGFPVIPVIVVCAIDTDLYRGYDFCCWMKRSAFYYAFFMPVCVVLVVNTVIYIMVVVTLCRRPDMGQQKKPMLTIRASFASFVFLGLSWMFSFFTFKETGVVFEYIFTTCTTLQGFLIFILFTARDPAVRTFWKDKRKRVSGWVRGGFPCLGELSLLTEQSMSTSVVDSVPGIRDTNDASTYRFEHTKL